MDSINKQQPEDNQKNLFGAEALDKIKELAEKAKSCLFCTAIRTGEAFATRPMAIQEIDEDGNLWFLSAVDSYKNQEIGRDNHVQLLFQGSSYSDFMTLYGKAYISRDRARIKALWKPIMKDWFTEGEDDPRITVIKVVPANGYYWDTKNAMVVGMVKRLVGAAIGKTLDDSIEGDIQVQPVSQIR